MMYAGASGGHSSWAVFHASFERYESPPGFDGHSESTDHAWWRWREEFSNMANFSAQIILRGQEKVFGPNLSPRRPCCGWGPLQYGGLPAAAVLRIPFQLPIVSYSAMSGTICIGVPGAPVSISQVLQVAYGKHAYSCNCRINVIFCSLFTPIRAPHGRLTSTI